jgi:DNA topoisomerase-1
VNAYLKETTGEEFTAKDFRTWAGTVLICAALRYQQPPDSPARAKKNVVRAIEAVAGMLGNTVAVCRKSYIHPRIVEAYEDGVLLRACRRLQLRPGHQSSLGREEALVRLLLRDTRMATTAA